MGLLKEVPRIWLEIVKFPYSPCSVAGCWKSSSYHSRRQGEEAGVESQALVVQFLVKDDR